MEVPTRFFRYIGTLEIASVYKTASQIAMMILAKTMIAIMEKKEYIENLSDSEDEEKRDWSKEDGERNFSDEDEELNWSEGQINAENFKRNPEQFDDMA